MEGSGISELWSTDNDSSAVPKKMARRAHARAIRANMLANCVLPRLARDYLMVGW